MDIVHYSPNGLYEHVNSYKKNKEVQSVGRDMESKMSDKNIYEI